MNEHDSARLAALLDDDGLEACDDPETADVIVLNTCCIRENADNKLYGHLGHLKTLKDRNPDLQIAVGGCLAQKDREVIQRRAPWVDAVWGTHNLGRAVELLDEARAEAHVVGHWRSWRRTSRPTPGQFPERPSRSTATPDGAPGSPSRSAATTIAPSASSPPSAALKPAGPSPR